MQRSKNPKEYTDEPSKTQGRESDSNKKNLENTTESGYGEMLYIEPSDGYRRNQMMSPVTEGRQTAGGNTSSRSPTGVGRSVIVTVRNDLNERRDTAQLVGQKAIPTLAVTIPSRGKTDERAERSPKTINMMDTEKETEYNIKTVNARRSPQNPVYQTYTITQEQQGNLALDQPMVSGSFIHQPEYNTFQQQNDSNLMVTSMVGGQKSSGAQNSMMMREGRDQTSMIKMSPNKNMDEFNQSGEKYDTQSNLNNLKTQMERNVHTSGNETEGEKPKLKASYQMEDIIRTTKEGKELTEGEMKKIVKKMTTVYDPQKTTEGSLIPTTHSIIAGGSDELFTERYRVLQKMNKLSSILLSKERQEEKYLMPREEEKRTFDRNTLNQSTLKKDSRFTKTPQHKFLYISLAMISSKGPNCEDRIILRKMRFEKGGVVDLAQETKTSKRFSVTKITRKAPPTGTKLQRTNPKYREKAAKVVQGWWRDLRDRYRRILKKIILIQSFWRGNWVRKYMYDIIYLSLLYQNFCQKIQKALVKHVRPFVWEKFFEGKRSALDALFLLFQKDHRFRAIKIRPYWETWKNVLSNYRNKNLKAHKMVNIRSFNDDKLQLLLRHFNRWRILTAFNKMLDKSKDADINQRKFFGMTKIMNGAERLAKRTGLKTVKPHLDLYLSNQLQRKAVSLLLGQNPKLKRLILRNYFGKWRERVRKMQMKSLTNGIFYGRIGMLGSKLSKNFLRKYLLAWWRKLPKDIEINYFNGSAILQKAVWRKTYSDPLEALKQKEDLLNTKSTIQRIFGVKIRQIRNHWKDYFVKWRNIVQRLKDGDIKNRLSYSLLNTMLSKRRRRILSNRFNHWLKVPKINMAEIFERFRGLINITERVVKRALIAPKKEFLEKLSKAVAPKSYLTAIQRLIEGYIFKERFFKRAYLNRWNLKCRDLKIYDLQMKLFKAIGGQNDIKMRRLRLARAFKKWHMNVYGENLLNRNSVDDVLKLKLLNQQSASRLFLNIKKHLGINCDKDSLRLGWLRWRNKTNLLRKKEEDAIRLAAKHMKKHNVKENGPDLLNTLNGKSRLNRRTKVLRSMPPKYKKGERLYLMKYFIRWKLRVKDFQNLDLKRNIKKKALYSLMKSDNSQGLIKAWYKWKEIGYQKKNNFPIIVGTECLKRAMLRTPWQIFKKRTSMMNLKIPHGMSLSSAIIRGKSGLAKSIFFRNFALRPYWRKWRANASKLQAYDSKINVLKKALLPAGKSTSKVMLRRALNRWREVCHTLDKLDLAKRLNSRLLKNMYGKNSKIALRRGFSQWKQNYRDYIKRLNDALLAARKISRYSSKPIIDKFKKMILLNDKYAKIKQRFIQAFRNNDMGNLAYCFQRWRDQVKKMREMRLKCIILRNLATSMDSKSEEYKKNRLHEALLRWRINAAPNKAFLLISNTREGVEHLKRGNIKGKGPHLLRGLRDRAKNSAGRHFLYQLFSKIDPNFNKRLLYKAFSTWKSKLPDTERMKRKFREMVERGILKPYIHNILVNKPVTELVEMMHAYDLLKRTKARPINDFCRALLNIKRQMGILKRNLFLKKRLEELDITFHKRFPAAFQKWRRTVNFDKANDNSKTIQKFLKSKMGNTANRKDRLARGIKLLQDGMNRNILKKIRKYSIWQFIKKVLINAYNNRKGDRQKTLKNYYTRWRNLLPHLRREEAATMIENNYRNLRSRNKVKRLRLLSQKMRYLTLKLFAKYLDKRKIAFNKWLLQTQLDKCNKNAKIIQNFVGKHLDTLRARLAKEKIKKMCRMYVVKRLKDAMIKASKIIGDKGAKLYTTLEDIYIRRPFLKLCTGMKWIGRIAMIKRIQPKIRRALRRYFVPFYFKRWYKNTVEDRNRKVIRIQKWFRSRMLIWRKKAELRRNFLLGKFLRKLTNDADLQLRIPFKLWAKKAQFLKLNDQSIYVQKIWRGNTSRKNVERILNQMKIRDLLRKSFKNQLADKIKQSDRLFAAPLRRNLKAVRGIDKRYATNNVIDYANDALRNRYLYKLTGKRAFADALSTLRYYFDIWRKKAAKMNPAARKIQKVFRGFIQRKRLGFDKKIKDRLLTLLLRCCRTDKERLAAAFRKWQVRMQILRCEHNSKVIQHFLLPKLKKLLNLRFKKWFVDHANKLVKRRLNNFGKFKHLRDTLLRMNLKTFLNRLGNKLKYDKLQWILVKKFKDFDGNLLELYKKKYFNDWRRNAKLRGDKLQKAALFIQKNFKTHLARMFLSKLRNKKARLLRLLLKLTNDNDLKKKVAFNIWRTNAQALKLDQSSRVIQNFLLDIQRKMDDNKQRKFRKRLSDGVDKLKGIKMHLRLAMDQIRSASNRKLFSKFNDDLKGKRRDHLKTGLDKIRDKEKWVMLNKIFKIPNAGRLRLLAKWFPRWRDQANKLRKRHGISMIQRNYRLLKFLNRSKNIKTRLNGILVHLHLKNENLLMDYFNRWRSNTKKANVLRAGNKIGRFVDDKLKDRRAKGLWHKFADNLNLLNGNYAALRLLRRLKQLKALDKLKIIPKRMLKDGWEQFLRNLKMYRQINKMKLLFNNFERRKEIMSLLHYFNLWKKNARKLAERDRALEKLVRILDTRRKIIGAETIGSACLVKKLFRTIPKVRALEFFRRLRELLDERNRMRKFGDALVLSKENLLSQNKKNFINKIYKLYVYNILKKFFANLNNQISKTKMICARRLLDNLKMIMDSKAGFNYSNSRKLKSQCPVKQMAFKAQMSNPKHTTLKTTPEKIIMPYFITYLQGKIRARRKEVMDALKDNNRANRFCRLYKTHSNKTMLQPKRDLYNRMKSRSDYLDKLGPAQLAMFKLLRKKWVRHVCLGLRDPVKRFRMIYLIKMTRMHKEIAKLRYIRELVRKWRFLSFSKRLARKKLELMYKSFHCGYLQMANEVFGEEDEINPSVIKEFERFGAGMGMFINESPLSIAELQFCKGRDVKYQFESSQMAEEFYEESKKEVAIIGENTDYYVDEEVGMGTVGKYQSNKQTSVEGKASKEAKASMGVKLFKEEEKKKKK